MKFLLNPAVWALIIFINSFSCSSNETRSGTRHRQEPQGGNDSVINHLSGNQKNILSGAKKCLEEKFAYDVDMAYHILLYRDKTYVGEKVYPGGDLSPELGVCTDVIIRALRYAGIVDLQQAIHEDLLINWNDYPMKRWSARKPDTNIDHRRVPNQMVWFRKYWKEPDENDFNPGDVVIWDINQDGWADHMGILSDTYENNTFYVIHNFPSPGFVAEEDVLNRWEIAGHYRISY